MQRHRNRVLAQHGASKAKNMSGSDAQLELVQYEEKENIGAKDQLIKQSVSNAIVNYQTGQLDMGSEQFSKFLWSDHCHRPVLS